mgnify:CR=1 FL=1
MKFCNFFISMFMILSIATSMLGCRYARVVERWLLATAGIDRHAYARKYSANRMAGKVVRVLKHVSELRKVGLGVGKGKFIRESYFD